MWSMLCIQNKSYSHKECPSQKTNHDYLIRLYTLQQLLYPRRTMIHLNSLLWLLCIWVWLLKSEWTSRTRTILESEIAMRSVWEIVYQTCHGFVLLKTQIVLLASRMWRSAKTLSSRGHFAIWSKLLAFQR